MSSSTVSSRPRNGSLGPKLFDTFDRTHPETEAQALHRLAARAHERAVKIVQNVVTNHHFATSASDPDKLHVVTLFSCDCPGFLRHGRCMHYALVLERYHSLPPIDAPDPDNGPKGAGATLPVPASPVHVNWGVIEDGAYLRRGAALGILDDRQQAALAELDRAAWGDPVTADDVVVSIVPAPRRQTAPRVENSRIAHAGTRSDGSTYLILHADAVVLDGVRHRVGDRVQVTDRRWGWVPARITCIRTVGSTGKVWKIDVDGTGYGETTRSLAEVRAVSSEAVLHAA